jgi:uncharacterized membrane protein
MNDHLYNLLLSLLERNNIRIDREELQLQLVSHPSYPSLHAVTGVMEHFRVPSAALKVPVSEEVLSETPNHFLATLSRDHRDILSLIKKQGDRFQVAYSDGTKTTLKEDEFLENWTGIIAVIEKDADIVSAKPKRITRLSTYLMIAFVVLITSYFIFQQASWYPRLHFLISLLGFGISGLIVKHEIGMNTGRMNNLCNITENTSCDAILQSKAATLFGSFKLSDLSLVYFGGVLLTWIIGSLLSTSFISFFSALSILTFPVVVYSLVYQAGIVKKWCPLCLGISGILLLQFAIILTVPSPDRSVFFELESVLVFLGVALLISAIWIQLKLLFKDHISLNKLKVDHQKFKRRFSLFNALYKQGNEVSDIGMIPGELVFGSDDAPLKLHLVTSPFCGFCKQAHTDLETILKKAGNKVSLTIRFLVDVEDPGSRIHLIATELLRIYNTSGPARCLESLKDIYAENIDLDKWISDRNLTVNTEYDAIHRSQMNWATDNGINFTPAFYLNYIQFPREYERTDLIYFIDDLFDEYQSQLTMHLEAQVAS